MILFSQRKTQGYSNRRGVVNYAGKCLFNEVKGHTCQPAVSLSRMLTRNGFVIKNTKVGFQCSTSSDVFINWVTTFLFNWFLCRSSHLWIFISTFQKSQYQTTRIWEKLKVMSYSYWKACLCGHLLRRPSS